MHLYMCHHAFIQLKHEWQTNSISMWGQVKTGKGQVELTAIIIMPTCHLVVPDLGPSYCTFWLIVKAYCYIQMEQSHYKSH